MSIIFTGVLDNFSPDGTTYKFDADYKFMINTRLVDILKQYYFRICFEEETRTKVESRDFWNNIANGTYTIDSSKKIIESYKKIYIIKKK